MARRTILLTGAAGVIGTALLPYLRDERVVCMTRATSMPPVDFPVEVLAADVAEPGLGLEGAAYRALAGKVDLVIHAAAVTDWAAPVGEIRRANVEGTRNVVEFCAEAGAELVHIGTAFVQALSPQAPLILPPDNTIVNYVRSKIDSDEVVRAARIPATIIRPSNLVGETGTGWIARSQIIQLVSEFVLRGKVPYVPLRNDALVDVLPQDTVGAAIAAIALREEPGGDHWLTAGPEAIPLAETLAILLGFAAEIGRPVDVPRQIDPAASKELTSALPPLKRAFFEKLVHFVDGMIACGVFPTSMPELRERYELPYLPPPAAFRRGLEYWAAPVSI